MSASAQHATLTVEDHAAAMADYVADGRRRALALGNRGPLVLDAGNRLHPDILAAYHEHGFYVFEGVIGDTELAELRAALDDALARAPVHPGADVDALGRTPLGTGFARPTYMWVAPLADPVGGTDRNGGRHPVPMDQPRPPADAPAQVPYMMFGMCQIMEPALRVYGHPQLLAAAATLNGDDFVPYNDAIFIKPPGLGGSVAWHQDGLTHWNNPDWDEDIHGFNFQVQVHDTGPASCLWAVPGTHKLGRIDIKALTAAAGSERLPDAVPLFCGGGDVTMVNRQTLHGSFANTSNDLRISLTFGFHKRSSVIGQRGVLVASSDEVYDEARIFARSRMIQVAIDARAQRFPAETPFRYAPFAGLEDDYRWNDITRERVVRDYNLQDLGI